MSASSALPPTRIVNSTIVSPADAQAFLSAFIVKADTDRSTSARGELVLSDQRRIEKALQGVFIPKPVETFVVKEKEVKEKAPKANAPLVEAPAKEQEEVDVDGQAEEAFQEEVQQQEKGGAIDKEQRKADKKARVKAEKLKREAERAAERKR